MTDGVPSSLYIYGVRDRILTKGPLSLPTSAGKTPEFQFETDRYLVSLSFWFLHLPIGHH